MGTKSHDQNRQIAAQLLEKDGTYTIDGDPVTFGSGWQVGLSSSHPGLVNPTLAEATAWVAHHRANTSRDRYIGSWTDDGGTVYLDLSVQTSSFEVAKALATVQGEKAIWHWAEMKAHDIVWPAGIADPQHAPCV